MQGTTHSFTHSWRMILAVAVMLVVAGAVTAVASAAQGGHNGEGDACCFTNPQYAGICRVTPVEGETCESILAYLNNPMSSGKGYCSNTEIRGGWKTIDCHHARRRKAHGAKHHPRHPKGTEAS